MNISQRRNAQALTEAQALIEDLKAVSDECATLACSLSNIARTADKLGKSIERAETEQELWRVDRVAAVCGVSKNTVWIWCKKGTFPKPVLRMPRLTQWSAKEVLEWIELKQHRDEKHAPVRALPRVVGRPAKY